MPARTAKEIYMKFIEKKIKEKFDDVFDITDYDEWETLNKEDIKRIYKEEFEIFKEIELAEWEDAKREE